jgi:DNA polymerase V
MIAVKNIGESDSFKQLNIPMFLDAVPAGFPSPATDY